jgi:hypothetical protein
LPDLVGMSSSLSPASPRASSPRPPSPPSPLSRTFSASAALGDPLGEEKIGRGEEGV